MTKKINHLGKTRRGAFRCLLWMAALALLLASPVQAATSLLGYWTFDDGVDGTASFLETVGNYHFGTITGGYSFLNQTAIPGDTGKYLQLDPGAYAIIEGTANRADQTLSYLGTYDNGGQPFSVSMWVNTNLAAAPQGDASWSIFLAKEGETYGYQLRQHGVNNGPSFTVRRNMNADGPVPSAAYNLYDGGWHHLVGVYGLGYRELYMDGNLVYRMADTNLTSGGEGEYLMFGAREVPGGGVTTARAGGPSLDNVAYFKGALSPAQVAQLNGGTAANILTASDHTDKTMKYSLASANAVSSADSFLPDLALTRVKGADSQLKSSWMEGTKFVGDNTDYLQGSGVMTSPGMDMIDGSFSVSTWFKLDSLANDQALFGVNPGHGTNLSAHFVVRDEKLLMGFFSNDVAGNTTLETGKWYHATFAFDATTGTQSIYLNGQLDATQSGKANFVGNAAITLGTALGDRLLNGNMYNFQITNHAVSAAEAATLAGNNKISYSVAEHYNADEWYNGSGVNIFASTARGAGQSVNSYNNPGNIYAPADADAVTGMVWGPQFVLHGNSVDFSFTLTGGVQQLLQTAGKFSSRTNGGEGFAIWDMTAGDFARDGSGNIITVTNTNQGDNVTTHAVTLNNMDGHQIMVVGIDRQTGGWAWSGITEFSTNLGAASAITTAAQHHLVLQDYNFDTAGNFHGWFETDATGAKISDTVTHFTLGNLGDGRQTAHYVDTTGTLTTDKGFLTSSTATVAGSEATTGVDNTTGMLRSKAFLAQGDIIEFLVAGGTDSNLGFELVDAKTNEVLHSAVGEMVNTFGYDFWSLKDIQNRPVYLRLRDEATGDWGQIGIDQVRSVMFAPTQTMVDAYNNRKNSTMLELNDPIKAAAYTLKGFENGAISSLADLADAITNGTQIFSKTSPTIDFDGTNTDIFGETPGAFALQAGITVNMPYSGFYTLAINSDDMFRLLLDGAVIMEGGAGTLLDVLYIDEAGWFDLELQYANTSDLPNIELLAAYGSHDSLGTGDFQLLGGIGLQENAAVPEPGTWVMLLLGAFGLFVLRKKTA